MQRRPFVSALSLVSLTTCLAAVMAGCASPTGPNQPPSAAQGVYFIAPADGATLSGPFKVQFGLKGMDIKPAGDTTPNTGHHHLLINLPAQPKGQTIPMDEQHRHFGKGQTETDLSLPPGDYTLTMQFADGYHASYGPEMSATIHVTVK